MVAERLEEKSEVEELSFKDIDYFKIREFLPGWEGGTHRDTGTIIYCAIDGRFSLQLSLLTHQDEIWMEDPTFGGLSTLDESYYNLRDVESVMMYRDEGKIAFLTRDKRGKVEISNNGKTILYQNHKNRTDKTVVVNLP